MPKGTLLYSRLFVFSRYTSWFTIIPNKLDMIPYDNNKSLFQRILLVELV